MKQTKRVVETLDRIEENIRNKKIDYTKQFSFNAEIVMRVDPTWGGFLPLWYKLKKDYNDWLKSHPGESDEEFFSLNKWLPFAGCYIERTLPERWEKYVVSLREEVRKEIEENGKCFIDESYEAFEERVSKLERFPQFLNKAFVNETLEIIYG